MFVICSFCRLVDIHIYPVFVHIVSFCQSNCNSNYVRAVNTVDCWFRFTPCQGCV